MRLASSALSVLTVICVITARAALAADADCLTTIQDAAKRTRQHTNIYLGEMKNMSDNPWARNSASVCSSAVARAEQYQKRQVETNALCVTGSTYVDSQAMQLYKTAHSTCRAEFDNLLRRMAPDEQRLSIDRVARAEAELR